MKNTVIKVYSPDGTFMGTANPTAISSFVKRLNGGLGEIVFTLGEKFDARIPIMALGNNIEVHVFDSDVIGQPSKLVYSGYVTMVERNLGAKESVTVHCLGHHTKLALDVVHDGDITKLLNYVVSPGQWFKWIIDNYRENNPDAKIHANETDFHNSGTDLNFTMQRKTYLDAIEMIRSMSDVGQTWYVDANGRATFLEPGEVKHKLIFGRHFSDIKVVTNLEPVRTQLLYFDGQPSDVNSNYLYKRYTDQAAKAKYGARLEIWTRNGQVFVKDNESVADTHRARATHFLKDRSQPPVTVTCTVFDNNALMSSTSDELGDKLLGYDIESIEPRDIVRFSGFDETKVDFFRADMMVTAVEYAFDSVKLTLDVLKNDLTDWQRQAEMMQAENSILDEVASFTDEDV